jgi:lysophospholipase L1-like esterase
VWILRLGLVVAALGCASRLTAADPFAFQDGDRVVLLGSTLIEREQKYGYWELMLTLKNKDKNVIFRNLGWSGDTVFGEARNGFDESPKGFERLASLTKELKPTVIVVCYGHNESFEGKAGFGKFVAGLEKLLDALADTMARIVVISPTPFEKTGAVTDVTKLNHDLDVTHENTKELCLKRGVEFVDLFYRVRMRGGFTPPLTENGMHYGSEGYRRTAHILAGGEPLQMNSDRERLRAKIVEKNQLFFHRWRPQNETYLFGFRKHEQGKNAAEVAAFDPLVAKAEKEIAELRKQLDK